jgi:hypothetical protein
VGAGSAAAVTIDCNDRSIRGPEEIEDLLLQPVTMIDIYLLHLFDLAEDENSLERVFPFLFDASDGFTLRRQLAFAIGNELPGRREVFQCLHQAHPMLRACGRGKLSPRIDSSKTRKTESVSSKDTTQCWPAYYPCGTSAQALRGKNVMAIEMKGAHAALEQHRRRRFRERQAHVAIVSRRDVVTFKHPFRIRGIDRLLPAGDYEVVTDHEAIEGLSFTAFRRVATMIMVPARILPGSPSRIEGVGHAPPARSLHRL